MNKIIAVDFDGTLCDNKYPDIGDPNLLLINSLIEFREKGNKVILWTCRTDTQLSNAVEFCKGFGLEFDCVNDNLPEIKESFGGDTRKVVANWYIDDRAIDANLLTEIIREQNESE